MIEQVIHDKTFENKLVIEEWSQIRNTEMNSLFTSVSLDWVNVENSELILIFQTEDNCHNVLIVKMTKSHINLREREISNHMPNKYS